MAHWSHFIARTLLAAVCVMPALALPAWSGAMDDANQAYQSGRYGEALRLLGPLAEGGDPAAQFKLGQLHYLGHGVEADRTAAARWFYRAAVQGHGGYHDNIRVLYEHQHRVPPGNYHVLYSYKKDAQNGDPDAQFIMGSVYDLAKGVIENDTLAMNFYTSAADQGQPDAQASLGALFAYAVGVPRNAEFAVNLSYLAARQFLESGELVKAILAFAVVKGLKPNSFNASHLERKIGEHPWLTAQ